MAPAPDIHGIVCRHLHDPGSSFSIGCMGAIAEFHRGTDEPLVLDDPAHLTIATARGGLRIELVDGVIPRAYETLSRHPERWQHGVVFCLPANAAASHGRTVLSEIGPDRNAIRNKDRNAILFDIGLGARNIDFCIRTAEPALLADLRRHAGRSVFAPGNPVMAMIIAADPHRVAISKLGRIEVYQPIGRSVTPEGPHTHVLPKLLENKRTHAANVPVPAGCLPCLSLYPAHPLLDAQGRSRTFDRQSLAAFETLLECWGAADYRAEKARVAAALRRGLDPESYTPPRTRLGRTALRIILRQMRHVEGPHPLLNRWRDHFERTGTV
ncbi:MAG: hypothetical protein D6826_04355 [Alphaproteobacteria bacterium]|nr:MAG: hypothetical protein D6826_04355 [Alphaproteobacteria bacterium]